MRGLGFRDGMPAAAKADILSRSATPGSSAEAASRMRGATVSVLPPWLWQAACRQVWIIQEG